jgi:peptidoglycan/xylan/chitin deacetylase (PgdA/CDA1 family)
MKFSFLAKVARRLRRPRRSGGKFIFLYHRIASPHEDPFALAVPEKWFQDHLDILRSHCRLVGLDEIIGKGSQSASRLAAITFDDGYTDNLTTASPILRGAGIPATFFICTGSVGDVRGFWWDRVARAVGAAAIGSIERAGLADLSLQGDLSDQDGRRTATLEIAARLRPMHPVDRDGAVARLEGALLGAASVHADDCSVLDEAGLRELASLPLTEIGAHTKTHAMLSMLTRGEQLEEIATSVEKIRAITQRGSPRFLAYPYGAEQDYNADSCLAARDAGLEAAFTNHAGPFDARREPYRMPRYYVPPLPPDHFRSWLQRLLDV